MKQSTSLSSGFAIIVGVFLLLEGLWGMSSDTIFGILTTNQTQATIHIILGITGIYLGVRQKAKPFCVSLGLLLLAVGILRFVDGAKAYIVSILNVNENVAYLNIFIGLVSFAVSFAKTEKLVDKIPSVEDEIEDEIPDIYIPHSQKPATMRAVKNETTTEKHSDKVTAKPVHTLRKVHPVTEEPAKAPGKITQPSKTPTTKKAASTTKPTKTTAAEAKAKPGTHKKSG